MKRLVPLIFCLIPLVGQASAPSERETEWVEFHEPAISSPANVKYSLAGQRPWGGLATVQLPAAPAPESPARTQQPVVRLRPLTYVLLALSTTIGPILIFLLFRKKIGKQRSK